MQMSKSPIISGYEEKSASRTVAKDRASLKNAPVSYVPQIG
jgi:hypothetical protein